MNTLLTASDLTHIVYMVHMDWGSGSGGFALALVHYVRMASGASGASVFENNGQPKYIQLANHLRRRIRAGALPVGHELPSTARLAATYEVSTTVVRAAVRELQNEGLVRGQPGKAVYVYSMAVSQPVPRPALEVLTEEVAELRAAVQELTDRVATLEAPKGAEQ